MSAPELIQIVDDGEQFEVWLWLNERRDDPDSATCIGASELAEGGSLQDAIRQARCFMKVASVELDEAALRAAGQLKPNQTWDEYITERMQG